MLTTKENLKSIAVVVIAAVLLVITVTIMVTVLDRPDVYVSTTTGQCVKVVNYTDDKYTCDDIPKSYNHVPVL